MEAQFFFGLNCGRKKRKKLLFSHFTCGKAFNTEQTKERQPLFSQETSTTGHIRYGNFVFSCFRFRCCCCYCCFCGCYVVVDMAVVEADSTVPAEPCFRCLDFEPFVATCEPSNIVESTNGQRQCRSGNNRVDCASVATCCGMQRRQGGDDGQCGACLPRSVGLGRRVGDAGRGGASGRTGLGHHGAPAVETAPHPTLTLRRRRGRQTPRRCGPASRKSPRACPMSPTPVGAP